MTEHNIPTDATYYFLWWTGIHVYKKEKGVWMYWNGKQWKEELDLPYYKIKWFFGYYLHAGDYKHRLHKISKGVLGD